MSLRTYQRDTGKHRFPVISFEIDKVHGSTGLGIGKQK